MSDFTGSKLGLGPSIGQGKGPQQAAPNQSGAPLRASAGTPSAAPTAASGAPLGQNPTGSTGPLISDGTIETFENDVLAASMTMPIIVDFWAPWCGPCKQLTPMLEAVVTKAGGAVKLVKIDIDKNQMLASQLRVQSVPTVYAFSQGQPVDGFMGAVPQSELDAFIERLLALPQAGGAAQQGPSAEEIIDAAKQALEQGDIPAAAQLFGQVAQTDPDNLESLAGLARCFLAMGEIEQAKNILASVPEDKQSDSAIKGVHAAIELAGNGSASSDVEALKTKLETSPEDHGVRFELAESLIAAGNVEAGADELLILMERDQEWNEEAARKKLLTVFEAMGPMDPIVKSARRRMSAILFR